METSEMDNLVTIITFQSEIEAEIVRGALQNAGIRSYIFKDDCGGTRPHLQLTLGVELKVSQNDFDRASYTLKNISSSETVKSRPGENKAAILSIINWIFCFASIGFMLLSLSKGKSLLIAGIVLLIIGIIFWVSARKVKKSIK